MTEILSPGETLSEVLTGTIRDVIDNQKVVIRAWARPDDKRWRSYRVENPDGGGLWTPTRPEPFFYDRIPPEESVISPGVGTLWLPDENGLIADFWPTENTENPWPSNETGVLDRLLKAIDTAIASDNSADALNYATAYAKMIDALK